MRLLVLLAGARVWMGPGETRRDGRLVRRAGFTARNTLDASFNPTPNPAQRVSGTRDRRPAQPKDGSEARCLAEERVLQIAAGARCEGSVGLKKRKQATTVEGIDMLKDRVASCVESRSRVRVLHITCNSRRCVFGEARSESILVRVDRTSSSKLTMTAEALS